MAKCDVCGKDESMPYNCRHCGGTYCSEHRLPENHDCTGLQNWNDPQGVFDSGFDDSVNGGGGQTSRASSLTDKLPFSTGTGGPLAYFRGNMTYTLLALMWITFLAQRITLVVAGPVVAQDLFILTSWNVEYVWTWVTSVFAHGDFFHIVFNSIAIFFFGPLVERYVGSTKLAILFVVSGVLAGLGQIGISMAQGQPSAVLGASGAALAILGVMTVLNPNLRVYLFFMIPMPLWVLTGGFALVSIGFISGGAAGAFSIAHAAHLIGLLIGLAYGEYVKRTQNVRAPSQLQFGGGGPGGPGGPGGRRRF